MNKFEKSASFAAIAALCVAMALSPSFAADRTISADYTLTGDETVDGDLTVARGVTVDLAGHNLTVKGLKGGANSALVAGRYRLLEYVTATGSQYVHTDYTPIQSDRVEMKFRFTDNNNTYQFLYCTRLPGGVAAIACLRTMNALSKFRVDWGKPGSSYDMGLTSGKDFHLVVDGYTGGCGCDNLTDQTSKAYNSFTRASTPFAPPAPFVLLTGGDFDANGVFTEGSGYRVRGRFYWFRVYGENGELKCNIVPARDTNGTDGDESDDVIGFYNLVTGKFLTPVGTLTGSGDYSDDAGRIVNTTKTLSELRVDVPAGATVKNDIVAISGNVKVVKQGEGNFVQTRTYQTYNGGTDIEAGTLKCAIQGRRQPFGFADDNLILNGNFDAASITNGSTYQYTASIAWPENPHWTCDGKNVGLTEANGTWVNTGYDIGKYAMYLRSQNNAAYGPAHAEQTFRVLNPGYYRFSFTYMAVPNNSRKGATLRAKLIHGAVTNELCGFAISSANKQYFSRRVEIAEAGEYTLQFYQDAGSKLMANSIDDVVFAPVLEENNLLKNGSFDDGSISGSYQYASSTDWTECPYWTCDGANVGLSTANGTWAGNGTMVGTYSAYLRTYNNLGDAWFEQTMHIDDPGAYALWFTCSVCADSSRRNEPFYVLLIHGSVTNHLMSVTASDNSFRYYGKVVDITEPGDYTLQFRQYSTSAVKSSNINDVYFGRVPQIIVRDGATLDMGGLFEYDKYPLVMDGGTFVNSGARGAHNGGLDQQRQLRKVILSADSTFDMWHSYCMRSIENGFWNESMINLGGHELSVVLTNDHFYIENCIVTNGTIRAVSDRYYIAFIDSDSRAPDTDLILSRYLPSSNLSDVRNLTLGDPPEQTVGSYTGLTTVHGVFKCLTTNFGNTKLLDGAVWDLSENTGAFNIVSTAGKSQTISFADNATITFRLGARTVASGEQLVSWRERDLATLTTSFALESAAELELALDVRSDGIYVKSTATPDYATWDASANCWKYYKNGANEPMEWDGGVTSDMYVRFSTIAGYAAICATNFTPVAFVLTSYTGAPNVTNDFDGAVAFVPDTGAVFDVNGGYLKLPTSVTCGITSFVVTNSAEQVGTFEVETPEGADLDLQHVHLTGNLRLVKSGPGILVGRISQPYTGGTLITGGHLRVSGNSAGNNSTSWGNLKAFGLGAIEVAEGGTFDVRGNYDYCNQDIILDGGTFANSGFDMSHTDWGGSGFRRLTADSYLAVSNTLVFGGTQPVDLGGRTLTVGFASGKVLYLRSTVISNGVFNIPATGGSLYTTVACDARTVDFKVNCPLRLPNAFSVHDYEAVYDDEADELYSDFNSGGALMAVYGTFKPSAHDYFYGCTMQDGSTIDLSARTNALPRASAFTNFNTIQFADNATVKIKLGGRRFSTKTPIISWADNAPENLAGLTFKSADGESFSVIKKADGLYIQKGCMIIVR